MSVLITIMIRQVRGAFEKLRNWNFVVVITYLKTELLTI